MPMIHYCDQLTDDTKGKVKWRITYLLKETKKRMVAFLLWVIKNQLNDITVSEYEGLEAKTEDGHAFLLQHDIAIGHKEKQWAELDDNLKWIEVTIAEKDKDGKQRKLDTIRISKNYATEIFSQFNEAFQDNVVFQLKESKAEGGNV